MDPGVEMTPPSTVQAPPHPQTLENQKNYAEVVFNLPLKDRFTYYVPEHLEGQVREGMRVLVSFGKRIITGYVVSLTDHWDRDIALKPILEVPDPGPVVSREILRLTRWMADYYHASWGETIKAALPAGLAEESREVFSITDKGRQALENGWASDAAVSILRIVAEKRRLSSKQLQNQLKGKFNPRPLAKLQLDGWLTCESRIKRSTIACEYEKKVRLLPPMLSPARIEQMFKSGELISHVEVYEEILDGGYEEQAGWVKENKHFFRNYDLPAEGKFIASLGKDDELFVHGRKQKANHADPWLVAQAKINSLTLITEETSKGGPGKLPNICSKYGIKCIDVFGLIQEKNWAM